LKVLFLHIIRAKKLKRLYSEIEDLRSKIEDLCNENAQLHNTISYMSSDRIVETKKEASKLEPKKEAHILRIKPPKFWRRLFRKPRSKLGVVVPTINSTSYIDIIARYYMAANIDVVFYVDEKSTDGTFDSLNGVSNRIVVRNLPNSDATRIAEAVEFFSKEMRADWILRLDDDELPSAALLQFCKTAIERSDVVAYGFPRHQCIVSSAGRLLAHRDHPARSHRQWRLYQANKVTYIPHGHTPGFETSGVNLEEAPDEACIIHLDWSVHSYDKRREKIERYDAHTANHGSMWHHYYLFEEQGITKEQLSVLDLPEFQTVCRELQCRLPELCVDDRSRSWPPGQNVTN